jgi:sulfur relay (sulfurtransferase) DsrC/TusE family protein
MTVCNGYFQFIIYLKEDRKWQVGTVTASAVELPSPLSIWSPAVLHSLCHGVIVFSTEHWTVVYIVRTYYHLFLVSLFQHNFLTNYKWSPLWETSVTELVKKFPVHLFLLDLITLIIFGEAYIIQSSPVSCHFLPLRSKYSPQHLFSKILNLCSSLVVRKHVTHT